MKRLEKFSAAILAAALSLCLFPRVVADDMAVSVSETAMETTVTAESETAVETTVSAESETAVETTVSAESETDPEAEDENYGIAPASLLPLEPTEIEVYLERYNAYGLEDKPKCSFYVREALESVLGADYKGIIAYSYDTSNYRSNYSLIGWNDIITPRSVTYDNDEKYGYISYTNVYFLIGGDQLDPESPCYDVCLKFKYFDIAEDREVLIDRSQGMPVELQDRSDYTFFVKEVLSDIDDSVKISYSLNENSAYSQIKLDDTLEIDCDFIDTKENIYYDYVYFILDDGQNVPKRYCIKVKFKLFDTLNDFAEKIRIYGEDNERIGEFSRRNITLSNTNFEKGEYPGMLISLPEGYSADNVTVYDGSFSLQSELDPTKNITDKILYTGARDTLPYPMDHYDYSDDSNGYRTAYKNITFAVKMPVGSVKLIRREYTVEITSNYVSLIPVRYESINNYYEFYNEKLYPTGIAYSYTADSVEDAEIKIKANYYDYIGSKKADTGITFACYGSYSKESDAKDKPNIKESIFSSDGIAVDTSVFREETKYDIDGNELTLYAVDFTFIDIYEYIYNETIYFIVVPEEEEEPVLPDGTSFYIEGVKKKVIDSEGKEKMESYNKYIVSPSDDSYYYQKNYRTVFIMDGDESITRGTSIYPVFSASKGSEVYCDGVPVHSAESPLDFISEMSHQYTVAAGNKINTESYWVTYVTQDKNGSKLFVNGANVWDHYSEDTHKPQREVFLDSASDYHDILFANIGSAQMTGITAELTDASGVKLDPYWNITGNVRSLAAFTSTSNPNNIAKLRLVPDIGEDEFAVISGLLTISADGNTPVEIEITGTAGTPRITTENIISGIKYVPYQSIIMTNSTDKENMMEFSCEGGLPEGLSLLKTGEIYGIPKEAGEFTFNVRADYKYSDDEVLTARRTFTITIEENEDANVESANDDPDQGEKLIDSVSKNITLHYDGMDGNLPNITGIDIGSNVFHSDGKFSDFKGFYIDGKLLMQDMDYIAEEGSTKITVLQQTFKNIEMQNGSRHTLAAEFKDSNGKLTRSAQNIYLNYVGKGDVPDYEKNPDNRPSDNVVPTDKTDKTDGDGTDETDDSESGSGNSKNEYITIEMNIISPDNKPIQGISVELHSDPMYAETDSEGNVSFENVEFGRHTLFIRDKGNKSTASKKFHLMSGKKTKMNGDIITAKSGETLSLAVEYDGSKIKIISAAVEDVSAEAGTVRTAAETLDSGVHKRFWKFPIVIMCVCVTAGVSLTIVFIIRKKRKN